MMAAKKITHLVKLQIQAGKANPAPPVGPALGPTGINIMQFCKDFNEKTALIKEIEFKLNGTRDKNIEALKQIEESQADVSDIVGQVVR